MQNVKTDILNAVKKAQTGPVDVINIFETDAAPFASLQNEMLFFIKPELTKPSSTIKMDKILDIVFDRLEKFNVQIASIQVLGAKCLKDKNIMASHYGVINQLSNNAKGAMSQGARDKFKETYGITVDEANMMGGHEFLAKYPMFNADSLEVLYDNMQLTKLAGGTYCGVGKLYGETIYLINGFHPKQLAHFIDDGKSIVTFRVFTDTSWDAMRNDFTGATKPSNAVEGSLRQTFLVQKDALGLDDVSIGYNGVHLSAGPIEGLVELCRFSDTSVTDENVLKTRTMGKKLLENFSMSEIKDIVNNVKVDYQGNQVSTFDMTEEKNTNDALGLMTSVFQVKKAA